MFKFNLGLQVKETETGAVGTIFARAEYADGTPKRYLLEATDAPAWWWVDEDRLELCYGD